MLLWCLLSLSVGLEAGYAIPAMAFTNIQSGPSVQIFVGKKTRIVDLSLSTTAAFYPGDNAAYTLSTYGIQIGLFKTAWRFSPVVELGGQYLTREVTTASEAGYCISYLFGLLLNFRYENLRLYPKFYYEGITDIEQHAGFVGAHMGLVYEF